MKNEKLLNALEQVDEKFITASAPENIKKVKKREKLWLKWGMVAACLCMIGFVTIPKLFSTDITTSNENATDGEMVTTSSGSADYPAAIMVNDVVYYYTYEDVPTEQVDDNTILGYTESYTDSLPSQNGQTNFLRDTGAPYAKYDDGIIVFMDGKWGYFTEKK